VDTANEVLTAYWAAAAAIGRAPPLEPALLETVLSRLYSRGSEEHPDIRVAPSTFGRHIAHCNSPLADCLADLGEGLPAGDLFLACAAVTGEPRAIARVREMSLPSIRSYLRRIELPLSSLEEIAQDLWDALLLCTADRAPRLAGYSGTGSLRSFIGVTARRLALMRCRHESVAARAVVRAATEVTALADDVELDFIKAQYRGVFRQAIEEALNSLDDRLRMVLRMRVVEDLTVDGIARTYGVAQSSVSRWLARARAEVVVNTRRLLCERLVMSSNEFDSLWRVVVSQLDISVSTIAGCTLASRPT
jgi:RNA polymerase sigma-70 factor (ECF subfamily)